MTKILFVSHCILNTASKVELFCEEEMEKEENLRRLFLKQAIEAGFQLVQLPCPEFLLYGPQRWGHVSDQFDNTFFRNYSDAFLAPYIDQIKEYHSHPEKFKIAGVVGIDGSPSCGVTYTCKSARWKGDFSGRENVDAIIDSVTLEKGNGIFIRELRRLLEKEGLQVPVVGLFADEPQRLFDLLERA
ncbi:CD3072 family TudS-related putative desulfidase [Sediminispirochaeta smaragdinae]|uniref:Uncharacterized protein n=1 Tax=Sediminispirochaeta smaragdinae (strain DSM 11293 / JCM 15392 / SEBR 4228) TaxID=573413 RepID=E1R943_SEDSS|nr:CD3072 family TudS-related putative desulfidase [Sediminispirochaeta smaragdinae]ADK83012.1 Protein of unknown function DUF2297 [Sediminispirochaeta smaragdinae DSM 11293]